MPTVSVVVLSYNRPHFLREALASVMAQTAPPTEVIVVDNRSSHSEDIAKVVAEFSGIRLIANPENLGFTGGMNVGLGAVTGEYVYLTEDDVALDLDYLAILLAYAEGQAEAGIVAGVQYHADGEIVLCAGGDVRLGGVFHQELKYTGRPDTGADIKPFPVSFVPGSMMLARREMFNLVGFFRADFFMYYEDVELCRRVWDAGYSVIVVPSARARHLPPVSTGIVPAFIRYHQIKNLLAVYLLHADARVLPEFLFRYGIYHFLCGCVRDRSRAWLLIKAWCNVLLRLAPLLRDRRKNHVGQKRRSCLPGKKYFG